MGSAKTIVIVAEQAVLEDWKGDVDIIDAALIWHVHVRATRRANQRSVKADGVPCYWVHYPTLRKENWMITLSDKALSRRFTKLVRLGLLVRKQVSLKNGKGSRAYYGESNLLKTAREEVDAGRYDAAVESPTHTAQMLPHSYDAAQMRCAYDTAQKSPQSLSKSLGKEVFSTAPQTDGVEAPPPRRSADETAEEYVKELFQDFYDNIPK